MKSKHQTEGRLGKRSLMQGVLSSPGAGNWLERRQRLLPWGASPVIAGRSCREALWSGGPRAAAHPPAPADAPLPQVPLPKTSEGQGALAATCGLERGQ